LLRLHADGIFREETQFLPMNLRWALSQPASGVPEIFASGISPHMGKHCDLGHKIDPKLRAIIGENLPNISESQAILVLDLEVPPSSLSHLISQGQYRLELKIAAANSTPVTKTTEINLTGQWYAAENKMFSDGIGLKEISRKDS
jgi:hypothetical protein